MARHHIMYIPGLNDQMPPNRQLTLLLPLFWSRHGFVGHIMAPHWTSGAYEPKLQQILDTIDSLSAQGKHISLVGQSAGSSLALNAFAARSASVAGLVILTGRLRVGGRPTLAQAARHSPAFAQSVQLAEAALPHISAEDRARIMTIRPATDRVVPPSSVPIAGANNLRSRLRGHSFGGLMLASLAARQWLAFLQSVSNDD